MSDEEALRLRAYRREVDRRRFLVGATLVRFGLATLLDARPEELPISRTCDSCGAPHGKPRHTESRWQFSVSHAGDYVVAAFSQRGSVGIDIEPLGERPELVAFAGETLTPRERRSVERACDPLPSLLTYWTRKEAVLKCLGVGLAAEPSALEVSPPDQAPRVLKWHDTLRPGTPIVMRELDFLPGHVGCVAIATSRSIQLEVIYGSRQLGTSFSALSATG